MSNCLYYKITPAFDNIADDEESWFNHFNQNGFHAPKVSMETISISSKPDCPLQDGADDTTSLEIKDSQQRFLDACQKGDLVTVAEILSDRALSLDFVDPRGFTPLQHTIKNGHEELCKNLISDKRIDIKDSLHTAVENGKDSIAKVLLEFGISPNEPAVSEVFPPGVTPLLLACLNDNAASIQLLLG